MEALSGAWPLADRRREVDAVAQAMEDPTRSAVVLYGPPGVGKTRLADTCLALAEAAGRPTARVMASQAAALLPLGALAPILPVGVASDASPAALFERARDELLALGTDHCLVLVVDDAHLLDTSSALLLTQLLDVGAVFVLATIRDGEALPDAVAGWSRRGTTLRLDLEDLGREQTGEVLRLALGGVVGTDAVHHLHKASGGNPLLLRELVLQALAGGQLRDDSGTWRVTGEIAPSRRLIDVLATRLAALDAPARRVVDQLAVCAPLGLAELTGDVPPEELDALERTGLISFRSDGRRRQLQLSHPLYGEALRAGLPVLRRRAILLATAERIEALGARRREDARRVATWRLDAGGTPDPDLLLHAARFARYAHDLTQVERLTTVLWSQQPTIEVAVLLGEAHYELGHFDEAEAVLAAPVPADSPDDLLVQRATLRSQNLYWGLSDDWRTALAVLREAQTAVGPDGVEALLAEEAAVWNFAGQPQKALDVVETIEPHTARTRVIVATVRSQALASIGWTIEAMEVAIEGFREHSALAEPVALSHPGVHIANQTSALVQGGRFAEADELARLAFDGSVAANIPFAQIWFAMMLGASCIQQGHIDAARRWLQEATSTAWAHGLRGAERLAQGALAAAEAVLGNVAAASAAIARAQVLPPFELHRFDQAIGWGWAAWAEGDPERARTILVTNATAAAALHNVGTAAWAWHDAARLGAREVGPHLAALADRSDSPTVAARAEHVRALEANDAAGLTGASRVFEELGMVLLAAEAASTAADAYRRQGEQRQGAHWTGRARSLADRCPGARTPGLIPHHAAVPLSPREREVAHLAGQGLASQDIADRLALSIRTVDNHLGSAYAKLGVNRRDQLAGALDRL